MKILRFAASSSWFLLNSLLVFSFGSDVIGAGPVSYQGEKIVRERDTVHIYREIPEATEPGAPEEYEWWERLRKAGHDLQKKPDEKTKKRFYLLMYEGQQKAYRIPLKDRPPLTLVSGRIDQRKIITGTLVLSVEYRADSSVGDIRVIKGLRPELDENVILATRQSVFLPAIKNGAFVTHREENAEFKFWRK
jgi:hypothetical protein